MIDGLTKEEDEVDKDGEMCMCFEHRISDLPETFSLELATHFPAEIINSDKIQVYKGLDIVTNKSPRSTGEGWSTICSGRWWTLRPTSWLATSVCLLLRPLIDEIAARGKVPIVTGGSNSYVEALVEGHFLDFKSKHDCCFLWVDVDLPALTSFVSKRVDEMVNAGLVEEVRGMFVPGADYTRCIRRAIGVPELDGYFKAEMTGTMEEKTKEKLLGAAIEEIKTNTHKLIMSQLAKIWRLKTELGWPIHHLGVTPAVEKLCGDHAADSQWKKVALGPSFEVLHEFLV